MRRVVLVFLVFLALILEISFFTNIKLLGVVPNVFLMLILASLFLLPEKYTFHMAFWGSLFIGLFSGLYFGSEALITIFILLILILSHNYIFTNINYLLLIFFSFLTTIFYDLLTYLLSSLSGYRVDILFFIKESILVQIVLNIMFVVIWYFLINKIWENLSRREERGRLLK